MAEAKAAAALLVAALLLVPSAARATEADLLLDKLVGPEFIAAPLTGSGSAADETLSPDDISAIERVERYLNQLDSLRSRFVQMTSEGNYAEGELVVDRPGMLRFEYDPPTPILMIADGAFLLYYDKELEQSTFLPLWETPLWFLVKDRVRLSGNVEVIDVVRDRGTVSLTLRDRELGDVGTITLVFSDRPLSLRKWTITDPQGVSTQVALVNPHFDVEVDRSVFDYSDLDIYGKDRPSTR